MSAAERADTRIYTHYEGWLPDDTSMKVWHNVWTTLLRDTYRTPPPPSVSTLGPRRVLIHPLTPLPVTLLLGPRRGPNAPPASKHGTSLPMPLAKGPAAAFRLREYLGISAF